MPDVAEVGWSFWRVSPCLLEENTPKTREPIFRWVLVVIMIAPQGFSEPSLPPSLSSSFS